MTPIWKKHDKNEGCEEHEFMSSEIFRTKEGQPVPLTLTNACCCDSKNMWKCGERIKEEELPLRRKVIHFL